MTKTFVALLRSSRLYYVILAIAPAVAGYLSTYQSDFSFSTVFTVGISFGLLSMAAWSANDAVDKEFDIKGQKKSLYGLYITGGTGGLLEQKIPRWIITTYIIILILVAMGLAITINFWFFALAGISGLVGIFYSLPPIQLKTRGLLGAWLTAISYGLVAFIAGCISTGGQVDYSILCFGAVMSVLVFGYDGLGHVIDYADDKANGLNTFVVQLGLPRAVKLLAVCQILPICILLGLGFTGLLNINLLGIGLMLLATVSTAILLFRGSKQPQYIYALRLISVPLLSAFFFLLVS